MLLDSTVSSYKILLMYSKKAYLKRQSTLSYRSSKVTKRFNNPFYSVSSSLFFNSFVKKNNMSSKVTLFFENFLFYNKYLVSNEYSSSYYNSYSSLYSILSFCFFVKEPFISFYNYGSYSYYQDTFMFVLSSHTNIFFPWVEASLNSNYCASQIRLFNTRSSQLRWFNTMLGLSRSFVKVSKHPSLSSYKKYSCIGLSYVTRGRIFNNAFCRIQFRFNVGSPRLTIKEVSPDFVLNSVDYKSFISYWGSSSIFVYWNYKNIL